MRKGTSQGRCVLAVATALAGLDPAGAATTIFVDHFESGSLAGWSDSAGAWALEESFDGLPTAPSQELLPRDFDYVVTHRTHPRDHRPVFTTFLADHADDCAGPASAQQPFPQHLVRTSHDSRGGAPDESFYVCRDHMMSSMGDVEGYSVTAFWPRQEFDFSNGGVLEFEVNVNDGHPRSWWEVLIAPRDQLKVAAAQSWLPIDETYPRDRIVLEMSPDSVRAIRVGRGQLAPAGWQVDASDWRQLRFLDPDDPALVDRRIRRQMRIEIDPNSDPARVRWSMEMADGTFDLYEVEVPGGLSFGRGLVLFKTHAYTPEKDGNNDRYTFHWDEIRFDGPVVGRYETFEAEEMVYLQANGSRPIGTTGEVSIELPHVDAAPVLFGQLHGALAGQVRLSINGGAERTVHPYDYSEAGCATPGWSSFRIPLDPSELVVGENTFTWKIGPRPACATWQWDGFSVKGLEVQLDLGAP